MDSVFNPKEETSIALACSMVTLFSLGKPMLVNKATKDQTRPCVARVNVQVNLLDDFLEGIELYLVEILKLGKSLQFGEKFNYLPKYCID